jgi:hypothetical protein
VGVFVGLREVVGVVVIGIAVGEIQIWFVEPTKISVGVATTVPTQ